MVGGPGGRGCCCLELVSLRGFLGRRWKVRGVGGWVSCGGGGGSNPDGQIDVHVHVINTSIMPSSSGCWTTLPLPHPSPPHPPPPPHHHHPGSPYSQTVPFFKYFPSLDRHFVSWFQSACSSVLSVKTLSHCYQNVCWPTWQYFDSCTGIFS